MQKESKTIDRYLVNGYPKYKVRIPITEDGDVKDLLTDKDSLIFDTVREYVRETALHQAERIIGNEPSGVFIHPEGIGNRIFELCDELVQRYIDNNLCYAHPGENGYTTYEKITLPKSVYELGRDSEQFAVETGYTILLQLSEFLEKGVWQIGFLHNDEIIIDVNKFPHPQISNGKVNWINDEGDLFKPVIWFGLSDGQLYPEWAIGDRNEHNWKSFWFNDFWCLDWNALFGGYDNYYTIWMFSECGMEEPSLDFDRVKSTCPIRLNAKDSNEELSNKVNNFLAHLFYQERCWLPSNILTVSLYDIKKESLRKALFDAGRAIGKVYIEANEDNESAERLPDNRVNPNWLCDGGFGDQVSESLNSIEDYLKLDNKLFPGQYDYNAEQGCSPIWDDILDKYFDYNEVEEEIYAGWDDLINEMYGEDWQHKY